MGIDALVQFYNIIFITFHPGDQLSLLFNSGISENIRREKRAHPEMSNKQAVAIALSVARKAGAKIPRKKAKKKK